MEQFTRSDVQQQFKTPVQCRLTHHDQRIGNHIFQPERHAFKRELARLDFGEIEDVIDDAQQRIGRRVYAGHVFALLV